MLQKVPSRSLRIYGFCSEMAKRIVGLMLGKVVEDHVVLKGRELAALELVTETVGITVRKIYIFYIVF